MVNRSLPVADKLLRVVPLITRAISAELRQKTHPSHYHLLAMLAHQECNLSELAVKHGVSLPSISSTIRTLEDRGWIRRIPAEHDRRVVMIALSPEGQAALLDMQNQIESKLIDTLETIPAADLTAVLKGLAILEQAFNLDPEPACAQPLPRQR
jgi:DNA-binding MarR family transcriptional regulator